MFVNLRTQETKPKTSVSDQRAAERSHAGSRENKQKSEARSSVTHLGTVQVLVFLQQLVRLLDRHLIVAIIKIICRNTTHRISR